MTIWKNAKRYVVKWLAEDLRKKYPEGFSTKQAVDMYYDGRKCSWRNENTAERHSRARIPFDPKKASVDNWTYMNACNSLCCMVQLGMLIRVKRGQYKWPETK